MPCYGRPFSSDHSWGAFIIYVREEFCSFMGGPEFFPKGKQGVMYFFPVPKGGPEFFSHMQRGDQNIFTHAKGRPEKMDNGPSQIDM